MEIEIEALESVFARLNEKHVLKEEMGEAIETVKQAWDGVDSEINTAEAIIERLEQEAVDREGTDIKRAQKIYLACGSLDMDEDQDVTELRRWAQDTLRTLGVLPPVG